MNSIFGKKLMLAFAAASVCTVVFHPETAIAQVNNLKERQLDVKSQKTNQIDEATLRKKMKDDGLSDPVIDKLIAQRKTWMAKGKNVMWSNAKAKTTNPITNATCGDMGVENGWGSWSAANGSNGSYNPPTWNPPFSPPSSPDFNIVSGSGTDANTPGPNAGDPVVPVVAPGGFGNNSIQLGQPCTAGCLAWQLTYPLTVTAQDTSFIYSYAIIIEDAGHAVSDQPYVDLSIYDSNGNTIPCGYFHYTGGPSIPGFYYVSGTGCGYAGTDQYKPWTLVGINLAPYIGQTLNIVITNVDCDLCGHWAYSYWDFMCNSIAGSSSNYCQGQPASICAPSDPNINYTYQWYVNGSAIPPPSGTQACITPMVSPGDTFTVDVIQPSGCNFSEMFAPQEITPQPGFKDSVHCNTAYFTDTSLVVNGSITGWNWLFPGGSPTTASTPSATVTYAPGTYTASLIITCNGGCKDTIAQQIVIPAPLTVNAGPDVSICQNNTAQLCIVNPSSGVSYVWQPSGQTTSCITVTTASAPSYTLTGTDANGCFANDVANVITNATPNITATGNSVCANGCAQIIGAGGVTYLWTPSSGLSCITCASPTSCPTATTTYTVTGTDANGCSNTATAIVSILPNPTISAGPNATICLGVDSAQISAAGGSTYAWTPGTGLSCINCPNPWANPPFSNTYTVIGTNASGCTNTATVSVDVGTIPVVAAIGSTTICNGDSAQLNANANNGLGPYTWYWSPPNALSNASAQNPLTGANTTTTYTVTVTDANGCKADTSTTIYVQSLPTLTSVSWTPEITCDGYIVPFHSTQSANGTSTIWDFGDGSTWISPTVNPGDSIPNPPPHAYSFGGTYNIAVTVFNTPCKDDTTITLTVGDITGFINILPANVFTPNGDNMNDCFHPAITSNNTSITPGIVDTLTDCITLVVYDRWGIKMFESTETKKCWDGKTKGGSPANEGTYYYIAKFGEVTLKGYVTLLRKKG